MLEFFKLGRKEKYIPSDKKRHEISKDEFSRKRAYFLRNSRRKLEEEFGIPISFSIHGSLIKGKGLTPDTAPKADIDMYIDIDEEDAIKLKKPIRLLQEKFFEELERESDALKYNKSKIQHIVARVINSQSINEALHRYKTNIIGQKKNKIFLASFFTLSIGLVVKKYRYQFLEKLANMEDRAKAEAVWQTIREAVEEVERSNNIPPQIENRFPKTLIEALKFYGIKMEEE